MPKTFCKISLVFKATGDCPPSNFRETVPLNSISLNFQKKFAALFVRLGDHGKIWNEQKFKHLEGSNQIFEFKDDSGRILCFFFHGKRVILTHGFFKKGAKTPKGEIERAHTFKENFKRRIKVWKEN